MTAVRTDPRVVFRTSEQLRLNARRLEHLAACSLVPAGEHVLDVGAGVGDLDDFFLDRDCRVTVTDARAQNIAAAKTDLVIATEGTGAMSRVRFGVLDLDAPPRLPLSESFGAVVCFGVIHLLARPAEALAWCAAQAKGMLLIDAVVTTDRAESLKLVPASAGSPDGAAGRFESRMSRAWLYTRLKQLMPHVYSTAMRPLHEAYLPDWSQSGVGAARKGRAMFIASRGALSNPALIEDLPDRYPDGP